MIIVYTDDVSNRKCLMVHIASWSPIYHTWKNKIVRDSTHTSTEPAPDSTHTCAEPAPTQASSLRAWSSSSSDRSSPSSSLSHLSTFGDHSALILHFLLQMHALMTLHKLISCAMRSICDFWAVRISAHTVVLTNNHTSAALAAAGWANIRDSKAERRGMCLQYMLHHTAGSIVLAFVRCVPSWHWCTERSYIVRLIIYNIY